MNGIIRRISLTALAAVLTYGALSLAPRIVTAKDNGTIVPDQTVKVDFVSDLEQWYKYTPTKQEVIQFESSGTINTIVTCYKDSQSGSEYGRDLNSGYDTNFMLRILVDPGTTYWFKVEPEGSNPNVSSNDTTVKFTVLPHTKVADYDSASFPDPKFRNLVLTQYDLMDDEGTDILTYDEMMLVTEIEIINKDITSVKGIEYFEALKYFDCEECKLTGLEIFDMPELYSLTCSDNKAQMSTFTVTDCPELVELTCSYSKASSISVSGCDKLSSFSCSGNKDITSLDVIDLPKLEYLYCPGNSISSLKIIGCDQITQIFCDYNQLTSLDVSGFPDLITLDCSHNQLSSIKLSKKLQTIYCCANKLTKLDLTGLSKLYTLECEDNDLTELDISPSIWLCSVYPDKWNASKNRYEGDVSWYSCVLKYDYDELTPTRGSVDPSEIVVDIDEDHFPDSNFRMYVKNSFDSSGDEKLSKVEIAAVTRINLSSREISTLEGIEYFTELEELNCDNNYLTELDLTKNTKLWFLACSKNNIKQLKIDKCVELSYIRCFTNQISTLDISKNTKLLFLACEDNSLTKLDIYYCPHLVKAYKDGKRGVTGNSVIYDCDVEGYLDCDKTVKIVDTKPTPTPTKKPTVSPTVRPTVNPTSKPSVKPTVKPSAAPSGKPTAKPSAKPSLKPTSKPTLKPTAKPSVKPTNKPTSRPTVKPTSKPVVSLTLNKSSIQLVCGKKDTLKATLKGSSSKLSWKSSDTSVATVDGSGKISAKKAGTVTITCSAAGKTANCKVTVLYKDVTNPKDFWFEPTNSLTAAGIVKGYDKQTKFKPANECTRAQMVTFIWRLQGEPDPKAKTCKFKDVKKTDYYYKACIWGNENHIVEGYKDGTFGPKIVCARRHAVTFLWRLAGKPAPKTTKNKFNDVKKTDYFYKATLWASEKGILAGYKDGTFRPNGNCLRRQMVTFLYKYDKFINVKKK